MRPAAKNVGQNISTQFLPTGPALITATDAKFRPEDTATKGSTSKDTNFRGWSVKSSNIPVPCPDVLAYFPIKLPAKVF